MSLSPLEYLRHMLDEAAYLLKVSDGLEKPVLIQDETLKRAIVRSIEIIGEAAKKVPDDFRSRHSQIDWRAMAGMRDKLIHDHFGIDYDIVWDVVINKMPALKRDLEGIIEQVTSSQE